MKSKIFEHEKETIEKIYLDVAEKVRGSVNVDFEIKKIGSSFLGVKGKRDVDIVVVVSAEDFSRAKESLAEQFGGAEKEDGDEWVKFEMKIDDYDVDLFLATTENKRVQNDLYFFEILQKNKHLRDEYEKLKVENAGDIELYKKNKFEFYQKVTERRNG